MVFIIRIYHDARSSEHQTREQEFNIILVLSLPIVITYTYQQMHIKCIKHYKLSNIPIVLHVSTNVFHLQGDDNAKEFIKIYS